MSVTPISDTLRSMVIAEHGTLCLRCGVQCTFAGPRKLHIDHVIPEARGGLTILDNLQVLCRTCNLQKGASMADYRGPLHRLKVLGTTSGHGVVMITGRERHTDGKKRIICKCGAYDTGWVKPWWSGVSGMVDRYAHHLASGVWGTEAQRAEVERLLGTVVPV